MNSGIYILKNKKNNKIYVGQSINLAQREKDHFRKLQHNTHENDHLQKSFNKYGMNNFSFHILLRVPPEFLNNAEKYFINLFSTTNSRYGYNKTYGGDSEIPSIEARQKMSKAKKKMYKEGLFNPLDNLPSYYKNGDFQKEVLSEKHKGKRFSPKTEFKKGHIPHNKDNGIIEKAGGLLYIEECIKKHMTLSEAAKNIGCLSTGCITKFLRKHNMTWGKLIQKIFDFDDNQLSNYYLWQNHKRYNDSGILRVSISFKLGNHLRPIYNYNYNYTSITARSLMELKKKVLKKQMEWIVYDENKVLQYQQNDIDFYKKKEKNFLPYRMLYSKMKYRFQYNKNYKKYYIAQSDDLYHCILQTISFLKLNDYDEGYISYLKDYLTRVDFYNISLVDYEKNITLCLNTGPCYNNCLYCFNDVLNMPEMSFHIAKYLIDKDLSYITAISITGGEPTLNKNLLKIVQYAKSQGLKVKIDTSLSFGTKNISKDIDLINISIKNYQHLLDIKDDIEYLLDNNYNCELNLVYHPDYLQDKELSQINNIISRFDIPLRIVEMDVSCCDFNQSPSRQELLKATSFFPKNDVYIETKANGIERVI